MKSGAFLPDSEIKKFMAQCLLVRDWASPVIKAGLLAAAVPVIKHAKAKHGRPKSREERIAHPDPRFYTWTGHLVQSIRMGKFEAYADGAALEILAGDTKTNYASKVEFGDARRRAFPYMRPALQETAKEVYAILGKAISAAIMIGGATKMTKGIGKLKGLV